MKKLSLILAGVLLLATGFLSLVACSQDQANGGVKDGYAKLEMEPEQLSTFVAQTEAEIWLAGGVDEQMVNKACRALDYIASIPTIKTITIKVSTRGGDGDAALDIVVAMKRAENKGKIIITEVSSYSMSAGVFISAAGTKGYRYVSPLAIIMIHLPSNMYETDLTDDERRQAEEYAKSRFQLLADLSGKTLKEIREACEYTTFLTGQEVIDFGFADKLLY